MVLLMTLTLVWRALWPFLVIVIRIAAAGLATVMTVAAVIIILTTVL
jgi:hypothetical protein